MSLGIVVEHNPFTVGNPPATPDNRYIPMSVGVADHHSKRHGLTGAIVFRHRDSPVGLFACSWSAS